MRARSQNILTKVARKSRAVPSSARLAERIVSVWPEVPFLCRSRVPFIRRSPQLIEHANLVLALVEYALAKKEAGREGGGAEEFVPKSEPLPLNPPGGEPAPGFKLDALYKEYIAEKGASIPALQKMMGVQT